MISALHVKRKNVEDRRGEERRSLSRTMPEQMEEDSCMTVIIKYGLFQRIEDGPRSLLTEARPHLDPIHSHSNECYIRIQQVSD